MSVRIPPSRQLAKQVTGITHKTNKTDDLKAIYDVRCVRTVRLGSPNTALLPYKMEGILQSLRLRFHPVGCRCKSSPPGRWRIFRPAECGVFSWY